MKLRAILLVPAILTFISLSLFAQEPPITVQTLCGDYLYYKWQVNNNTGERIQILVKSLPSGEKKQISIPKSGKKIRTKVEDGSQIEITYNDFTVTTISEEELCPVDGIEVDAVCTHNPQKSKFRFRNPNDFPVYVLYDIVKKGDGDGDSGDGNGDEGDGKGDEGDGKGDEGDGKGDSSDGETTDEGDGKGDETGGEQTDEEPGTGLDLSGLEGFWLPKAGKGKPGGDELPELEYRFKSFPKLAEDEELRVYFGDNQFEEAKPSNEICFAPGIELASVCSTNPNKSRWRMRNPNNHGVYVTYEIIDSENNVLFTKNLWLPKAGKGKEANPGDGVFEYKFFRSDALGENESIVTRYGDNQSITSQDAGGVCEVEEGTIAVTSVCSDRRNRNKYRIENLNDYRVFVTFDHNGNTRGLPKAGNGKDEDGNAKSGNYTFIYTSRSVGTLSFTYGSEQTLSHEYFAGPCEIDVTPGSCSLGQRTFTLTNAESDSYHGGNSNHSLWLSGFDGGSNAKLTFDAGSYLTYSTDGSSAYVYGVATMTTGELSGSLWEVFMPFNRKTDNTGPKKELKASAYDPNDGGIDPNLWIFYTLDESAFMNQLDGNGYINMRAMPADGKYGLQIGDGANGKNISQGASAWFFYSYNGQNEKQGDINVDMHAQCSDDDLETCDIFYIDNRTDKIYSAVPDMGQGTIVLTEQLTSPYGGAHMALDVTGEHLFVFQNSNGNKYGYFDLASGVFTEIGSLNVGSITQAAFSPYGQLYITENRSNEVLVFDDPYTGSYTSYGKIKIDETTDYVNTAGADIAFDQDGSFYLATHRGNKLYSVSGIADHLIAVEIGNTGSSKVTGLAILDSGSGNLIYSAKDHTVMTVVDMDGNKTPLTMVGDVTKSGWGDMTTGCMNLLDACAGYATSVIDYHPGTKANGTGTPVAERMNAENALGAPQESDNINFVSLGFGGQLILELESPVYNHNKNGVYVDNPNSINYGEKSYADLIIVETSFGRYNQNCGPDKDKNYPEKVLVYGKQSLNDAEWILIGAPDGECRSSFIDIAPAVDQGLEYVQYLKLVDVTDPTKHNGSADGYDVDGIIICPGDVISAITGEGRTSIANARGDVEIASSFDHEFVNTAPNDVSEGFATAYPNPVQNNLKVHFSDNETYTISMFDVLGKQVLMDQTARDYVNIDLSTFQTGIYILKYSKGESSYTIRVEKN